MLHVPVTAPDFGALTDALAAALPGRVDGLEEARGAVIVHPRGVDFTVAERGQLTALIAGHDGAAIRVEQAAKALALRKAKERAKDPTKLTDKERLTRLEALLDAD